MATYRFIAGYGTGNSGRDLIFPSTIGLSTELRVCPFGTYIGLCGTYSTTSNPTWNNIYNLQMEVYVTSPTLKLTDYLLWTWDPQHLTKTMYGYGIYMGTSYERTAYFPAIPISFENVMKFCNLFKNKDTALNDFVFTVKTRITESQILSLVPNIQNSDTVVLKNTSMTWADVKNATSKWWESWSTHTFTIANTHRYNYDTIDFYGPWSDAPTVQYSKRLPVASATSSSLGSYYNNNLPAGGSLYQKHTVATKGGFYWSGRLQIGWGVTSVDCISGNQTVFPYETTSISCSAQATDQWLTKVSLGAVSYWTGLRSINIQMISEICANPEAQYIDQSPSISFKNNFNNSYSLSFGNSHRIFKFQPISISEFNGYRSTQDGTKSLNGDYITFYTKYINNPCRRESDDYYYNNPTMTIEVRTLWTDELVYSETKSAGSAIASNVTYTIGTVELDKETTYKLTVTYTDNFTPEGAQGVEIISTVTTYFEWGKDGKGLAIGKYNEIDAFEIYFDIYFPKTCIFLNGTGVEQMGNAAALIPYDDTYNIGCSNVQEVLDWLNRRLS